MTAIRYKDYVAKALGPVPRTTSEIAADIAKALEQEGRAAFVDPHCVATNLRKLAAEDLAVRTAAPGSKTAPVRWSRPSATPTTQGVRA